MEALKRKKTGFQLFLLLPTFLPRGLILRLAGHSPCHIKYLINLLPPAHLAENSISQGSPGRLGNILGTQTLAGRGRVSQSVLQRTKLK